jgi:hypothetical protein
MAVNGFADREPDDTRRGTMFPSSDEGLLDETDALQRLERFIRTEQPGPLLVDLDETLFLRNSTETYLDSVRPRWAAFAISRFLDIARPWRWLPGGRRHHLYRDWLRVLLTSILLPWSLLRWRRMAPAVGAQWTNTNLLAALKTSPAGYHVLTFGFRPVVRPLLRGIDPNARLTVACGLGRGYRLRATGKRVAAEAALGASGISTAAVITDSIDDSDLLVACSEPLLVRWRSAMYVPAFANVYVPLLYTAKGKRAGQHYIRNIVLKEDVVLLSLAFAWFMEQPVVGALSLLVLHLSFWSIYEIGYHENDVMAVKREQAPNIPPGAAAYASRMHPRSAWVSAVLISLPALGALSHYNRESLLWLHDIEGDLIRVSALVALWSAVLVAARGIFFVYNRMTVEVRGFWYLALQLSRTMAYAAVLRLNLIGALALAALSLSRWMPYLSYRIDNTRRSHLPVRFVALIVFAVLLLTALVDEPSSVWSLQVLAIGGWLTLLSRNVIHLLLRTARTTPAVDPSPPDGGGTATSPAAPSARPPAAKPS